MKSVADALRERTREQVRTMAASERIEMALRLGDEDLHRFRAASGLGRQEALARLRAQRQRGRVPSACAEGRS